MGFAQSYSFSAPSVSPQTYIIIITLRNNSPEAPDECTNVLETQVTEPIAQSACLRGEVDTNKHQRKCAQNSSHSAYGSRR